MKCIKNKDSCQHMRLIFVMNQQHMRKSEMDFSKRGQRPDSRRSGPVIIRVSSKKTDILGNSRSLVVRELFAVEPRHLDPIFHSLSAQQWATRNIWWS